MPLNDVDDVPATSFNASHFRGLQYGCSSRGGETIIHITRKSLEMYPTRDHFFMDADNAFNRVSRWGALAQVREHFPSFVPFLRHVHGEDSNGCQPVVLWSQYRFV